MKATGGKANPKRVNELLKQALERSEVLHQHRAMSECTAA